VTGDSAVYIFTANGTLYTTFCNASQFATPALNGPVQFSYMTLNEDDTILYVSDRYNNRVRPSCAALCAVLTASRC
jgi:hypothetical protein